ncbi:D-Ala-D-Ala carboxypeptidase family metallohydrolase [Candidatus Latescibacterota bacterium]
MSQIRRSGLLLALLAAVTLVGCDLGWLTASEDSGSSDNGGSVEPSDVGPADPPYASSVVYPSGLRLSGLVRDGETTDTYPSPGGSVFPFDSGKTKHYQAVGYFIDIPSLSPAQRQEKVAANFSLDEYVRLPEGNGDRRVYVDSQISLHAQELRDAWGGGLNLASTYRSPEHNDAIGAAVYSRHQYGDAVDIQAPSRETAQDLYNLARFLDVDYLEPANLTIVGKNSPWVHLDDRGWSLNTPDSR